MIGYFAFPELEAVLLEEIQRSNRKILGTYGRLLLVDGEFQPMLWSQNTWLHPEFIEFSSISQAAKALRSRARCWSAYSFHLHRRSALIQSQISTPRLQILNFLGKVSKNAHCGAWTLLQKDQILASKDCSHPLPHGEVLFRENKASPPSRAYLKLWELFTIYGIHPKKGERCLDLGSSPGGWTWVLSQLGCHVISVDKSPIAAKISSLKNVEVLKQNAFTLDPKKVTDIDWLFSDIICYPDRLYELVMKWKNHNHCKNFVCTIKFQGKTDFEIIDKFSAIPGSQLIHLFQNKHELTWYLRKN